MAADIFDDAPEMELPPLTHSFNAGQQKAFDELIAFIDSPKRRILLEGWAGTGKTFTINRVVEYLKGRYAGFNIGMTAPTHKAVRQLKKHSDMPDKLDFGTIHSFLGLKEVLKPDPKNPTNMIVKYEYEWDAKKARKIDGIDLLIIDESSMLGDELYEHIDDAMRSRSDLKVIFMGDSLQIPPVGKKQETGTADAIPFVPEQRASRGIEYVVLSEIVRQKHDNPIIAYSAAIREQFNKQKIDFPVPPPTDNGIEILPRALPALRDLFLRYFDSDEFRADPDYMKVIAWRNETVNYFNREIRLIIHKAETLPKILVGEKMVMDKPLLNGEKIIIPNNEEIDILSAEVTEHTIHYLYLEPKSAFKKAVDVFEEPATQRELTVKVYACMARIPDGRTYAIRILHEDSEEELKQVKETLSLAAKKHPDKFDRAEMWKQFFKLGKQFAEVKYNYCLTAHKSQGSTYDYCISMEWDIDLNRDINERNRIKYVAATRARNKLFIVK